MAIQGQGCKAVGDVHTASIPHGLGSCRTRRRRTQNSDMDNVHHGHTSILPTNTKPYIQKPRIPYAHAGRFKPRTLRSILQQSRKRSRSLQLLLQQRRLHRCTDCDQGSDHHRHLRRKNQTGGTDEIVGLGDLASRRYAYGERR